MPRSWLGVLGIVVASLALVAVGALFLLWLGPGFTAFGALLALIPLAVVLFGVRWIDRWEPEPRGLLIFAFLWGAGMSVAAALIVGFSIASAIPVDAAQSAAFDFASSVVVAPIVEETAKGLGVLLIFLIARRAFDGPVDGIVYAAVVAGGFAFTENIEYFAIELSDPAGSISSVFFIRGILSPFAHVMFTAMTGLFIGLAAQRGGRWLGVGGFFVGLVPGDPAARALERRPLRGRRLLRLLLPRAGAAVRARGDDGRVPAPTRGGDHARAAQRVRRRRVVQPGRARSRSRRRPAVGSRGTGRNRTGSARSCPGISRMPRTSPSRASASSADAT